MLNMYPFTMCLSDELRPCVKLDQGLNDKFFIHVAQTVFEDGIVNWGRIAVLVVFGAILCLELDKMCTEIHVHLVANQITSYLIGNHEDWLLSHDAWVSTRSTLYSREITTVFGSDLCICFLSFYQTGFVEHCRQKEMLKWSKRITNGLALALAVTLLITSVFVFRLLFLH